MLTQKQYNLLMFINKAVKEKGTCPSFDEMRQEVGLKSKSGIHSLIEALEERGFIKRLPNRARAIEVIKLPKLRSSNMQNDEKVKNPQTTVSEFPYYGVLSVDTSISNLIDTKESCYLPIAKNPDIEYYTIRVDGDFMLGENIVNNDLLVIKKSNIVNDGDVVIATMEQQDDNIIKTLHKEGKYFVPATKGIKYRKIHISKIKIHGVVCGVFRQR